MGRRRSPADPGARRVLVELAQDTREKIREHRLAIEYYRGLFNDNFRGVLEIKELRKKIRELRRFYRQNRETVEMAEYSQFGDSPQARVLRSYGIRASSKGIPPEEWLNTFGYDAIMARRKRLAAAGGASNLRRRLPSSLTGV